MSYYARTGRFFERRKKGVKRMRLGNGYVERFNRTLEEGFIEYWEEELFEDLDGFNRELMGYLKSS